MIPEICKSAVLLFAALLSSYVRAQRDARTATIRVDARRVENRVSPRMYAAFVEMMAEDVKRGLTAEMLLDRSFEQPTDHRSLPAHWQLEPDERNDNVGALRFVQTEDEAYVRTDQATGATNYSLKVTLAPEDITDTRRGLSQGRLSIGAGQAYKGYFWVRISSKNGYTGHMRVALEADDTDGRTYAETTISADRKASGAVMTLR